MLEKKRPGFWCKFWQNHFSTLASVPCFHPPTSHLPFLPSFFLLKTYPVTTTDRRSIGSWRHKNTKDTPCPLDAPGLFEESGSGVLWSKQLSGLGASHSKYDLKKKNLSCKQHFSCKQNTVFQYSILHLCWKTRKTMSIRWHQLCSLVAIPALAFGL